MKKTYIFFVFVIVIFLTIAVITNSNIDFSRLLGSVSTSSDDIKMIVHAIDYGDAENGDAVLIESNGQYLLIDGGDYSKAATPCVKYGCVDNKGAMVIKYLKSIGVKNLSVYISHYDHDHYKNFSFYIIDYKENGTPYFHIDNVYLPNIENLKTEYNSRKQSCLSDTADSMNCQFAYRLAKIIGRQVSDNADKKVYKSGTGNEGEIGNYFDPQLYFLHYNLKNKPNVESDGVKYLTSTPNVESKDLTEDSTKITIGEATLNVIYHNPNTNPDNYKNYIEGKSQFEYNQNITEKLDSFQNNLSLVSMVSVDTNAGTKKFYMAGDIQYEIEQKIVDDGINIDADLMKLSHHGLETSNGNTNGYINKISPQYVFYQYGGESSYKNSTKDGKLVISYNGLHTNCGQNGPYINNSFVYCNEDSINTNRNLYKIAQKIGSSNVNSIGQSGSIKYIFKNDGTITRQCATSDCKIKSINVTYNSTVPLPNNDKVSTANQTFVTDLAEPYKLGYNYFGEPEWGTIKPFGFGGWSRVSDGYALVGWSTTSGGNKQWNVYSGVQNAWITSNGSSITLFAVWKPLYTYTLNNQGAKTAGTAQIYGVQDYGIYLNDLNTKMTSGTNGANAITKPTKDNYDFMGYYTGQNGTGTQLIDSNGHITSSFVITNSSYQKGLNLYAYWKPVQYTVEVKVTNGTGGTSKKVDYNTTTTFNNIKANTGYGSPSVSCTNSQTATLSGTTLTTGKITNNTVCTVKYSLNKYSVILNVVNGSGTSTQSISHGTTATFKNISPNTGYGNRQVSCDNSTYTFSGTTLTTGQITKKTTCSVSYSATTYTITYVLNDGTVSGTNPGTYNVNTATFTLINPTKKGYTFSGWTGTGLSKKTTTVKVTKGSTGNRTYTANYDAISYPITYNLNGGSLPSGKTNPSSYTVTTATFTLNNPTKDGYTFSGWTWTGHTTPTKSVSIQKGTIGAKEYTANYTPKEYTVTFNANGGSVTTTSKKVTYESTYGTLPTPTWTGHSFSGWYTEKDGGTKVTSSTKVTNVGNHTLYAHWGLSKYTVEVKVVNGTGATSKQVEYNKTTTFTVSPNSGYGNGNVSCTNNQTATLSGTTLTTGKITGNTTCTITYQKDSEPSIVIKDTTNLSLSGNNIITKLPTGTTKMTKQNFLSKITTTGEWKLYNKSNNEITSNTATVTTGSSIKSGTKEYKIVILGDIDQNGEVTVADLYQSYLLFKNRAGSLTNIQKAAADYDKNNKHDLTDLFNIYKKMKNK